MLIQTEFPDHPLYHALQKHDYDALAQTLLAERKTAGFPPFVYQALLRAEAHNIEIVLDFLSRAANLAKPSHSVELFDPVPAQMLRLKGLERAHLLIQSSSRKQLHSWPNGIYELIHCQHIELHSILDIDPLEF